MNLLRLPSYTCLIQPEMSRIQEGLESYNLPLLLQQACNGLVSSRLDSAEHMHSTMVAKLSGS